MPGITIRDVAKAAGTSVSAVSAVLSVNHRNNIRVSQVTRERILRAAADLKYTPNPVAKSLVTRKTGVLGLVFPYSEAFFDQNPFCTQVMAGVFEEVVREKYNLMLHTAIGHNWSEAGVSALLDPRVEGLILVLPEPNSQVVKECYARRFPCVCIVYEPHAPDICAVNADEFHGGYLATKHLLELGHRRIAHLTGNVRVATSQPRREGYLSALREFGVEADSSLVIQADFSWVDGFERTLELLDWPAAERPTAIFAANDLCADGVLRALRRRGLTAPDDMALVGYDDTWFAGMTQPPLTSVRMPILEMGVLAAQMLTALVEGREPVDRQPVLPVSLTVRESCGASKLRQPSTE